MFIMVMVYHILITLITLITCYYRLWSKGDIKFCLELEASKTPFKKHGKFITSFRTKEKQAQICWKGLCGFHW